MIHISTRTKNTPPSPIRRLSHLARQAEERGVTPLHLNIGQPDLPCPESFMEGLLKTNSPHVEYAPSEGLPAFREAWAQWVNRELGTTTDPEQYIATVGASEGLVFLFTAVCDPNDEIIIFDPTYANYLGFAAQSGVRLVSLLSELENGFELPSDEVIKKHISSQTRAILFCNPNNPTGVTYSKKEVERLLSICHTFGLYLIVDETYRELVYDGDGPQSVLNVAEQDPHVVVVDSLSKRFSLCGARLGTLYLPNEVLREKILHLAQARLAAPTHAQHAAAHMLSVIPADFLDSVKKIYQSRRDCLLEGLSKIPGVHAFPPSGAFYCLAKLPVADAELFASFLLADYSYQGHTLFVAPARGFYTIPGVGQDEVRLAFVLEEEQLALATTILSEGLELFKKVATNYVAPLRSY